MSSNYTITGLDTFITLTKDNQPCNYGELFSEFTAQTVGHIKYDLLTYYGQSHTISYGNNYTLEANVPQVTTFKGTINEDALPGTYTTVTEVKQGDTVIASSSTKYVIEK